MLLEGALVVSTAVSRDHLASHNQLQLRQWTLAAGETGDAAPFMAAFPDRSVQVEGTFGGTTITFEGSNDGTNWQTLTDEQGDALSFTVAGLRQILQCTVHVRPKSTGGAGASVVISLFGVRSGAH